MDEEILAVVEASTIRRWVAVGFLAIASFALVYVAMTAQSGSAWQFVLLILAALVLWIAERVRRATATRVELTKTELRDSKGQRIALIADIAGLDRGLFAFKPSNGFVFNTKTPGARVWRPGLWWRMGRRIGIGGVTPGSQARHMADQLAMRLTNET